MKRTLTFLIGSVLLLIPVSSFAQTELEDESDFKTRVSVGVDKKIIKGLHVKLEEELRLQDGSSAIDRVQTSLGVSYKVLPFLKAGITYSLLNPYKTSTEAFNNPRHRFSFELTGTYKTHLWNFSIKERLQITHRTGSFNTYQSATNAAVLKTRVSAKYKGFRTLSPYAFAELRNTLNAPTIKATYDSSSDTYLTSSGSETGEAGWFIDGWNNMYVNRIRGAVGCEYEISKQHALDFFVLADYETDKDVDANKEGTKLKAYTIQHAFNVTLGVGYTFSF